VLVEKFMAFILTDTDGNQILITANENPMVGLDGKP